MKSLLEHFIHIKLSKILHFSVFLLMRLLEGIYKNEEENKNRTKYEVQKIRDPTLEIEVGIPRVIVL